MVGPPLTGQGSGGPQIGGMGWLTPVNRQICVPSDRFCNTPREYYTRASTTPARVLHPRECYGTLDYYLTRDFRLPRRDE